MRTLAILILLANICHGQCPATERNSVDRISDAIDSVQQRRNEAARVQVEAARVQVEAARATAEIEKTRAEIRLIQQQTKLLGPQVMPATNAQKDLSVTNDWKSVFDNLSAQYPDISRYQEEIIRLTTILLPGSSDPKSYVEALYLTAKFSRFSNSPMNRHQLTSQLAYGDVTRDSSDPVFRK